MGRSANALTLYLSSWQKRMMKDFTIGPSSKGPSIRKYTKVIIRNPIGTCLASYKIPIDGMRKGDWVMYLTDEQISMVSEELKLRAPISAINITQESMKSGIIAFG